MKKEDFDLRYNAEYIKNKILIDKSKENIQNIKKS
jgi:hypothetical protein